MVFVIICGSISNPWTKIKHLRGSLSPKTYGECVQGIESPTMLNGSSNNIVDWFWRILQEHD